jgi:hypothetical protein
MFLNEISSVIIVMHACFAFVHKKFFFSLLLWLLWSQNVSESAESHLNKFSVCLRSHMTKTKNIIFQRPIRTSDFQLLYFQSDSKLKYFFSLCPQPCSPLVHSAMKARSIHQARAMQCKSEKSISAKQTVSTRALLPNRDTSLRPAHEEQKKQQDRNAQDEN